MPRGGPRPNSGGARAGAGRKRTRADAVRAVTVRLDRDEDATLTRLELLLGLQASEVLRRGLRALEREAASKPPRKRVHAVVV